MATCKSACLFSGSQITLKGKLEKLLPLLKSASMVFLLLSLSAFLKKYRWVVVKIYNKYHFIFSGLKPGAIHEARSNP